MKTTVALPDTIKPIIILNAPPRAGKDTLGTMIREELGGLHREYKTPMFKIAATLLGMTLQEFKMFYNKEEGWKDTKGVAGEGRTVRELLIHISEHMVKPFFGKEYFGQIAAESCDNTEKQVVYFTDGGFAEETMALCRRHPGRVVVVRLHRSGCSFDGDSRSYLEDNPLYYDTLDVDNDGTIRETMDGLVTGLVGLGYTSIQDGVC